MVCKVCKLKNDFADPNQWDGSYLCYECRPPELPPKPKQKPEERPTMPSFRVPVFPYLDF